MAQGVQLSVVAEAVCHSKGLAFYGKIGEGTFKESFKVGRNADYFALKIYKPGSIDARAGREIQVLQTLSHRNIVRLFTIDNFEFQGQQYLYLLEEFIAGDTLSSYLRHQALQRNQLLILGEELIDAVGHIAEHKLVHRDLKPDNIVLRDAIDKPVIIDFGIARDLSDQSLTADWLPRGPGTPLYAAPEQLNNQKALIDWRTDQFSLGVLLSFSIFGIHPYQADHSAYTVEAVAQRRNCSLQFIAQCNEQGLSTLKRMVAPWPIQRYPNVEELAAAWRQQGG